MSLRVVYPIAAFHLQRLESFSHSYKWLAKSKETSARSFLENLLLPRVTEAVGATDFPPFSLE